MQRVGRIVAGRITRVRIAQSAQSCLEIEVTPAPTPQDRAPAPVWCFAPAVAANGEALAVNEHHLEAAQAYFVGRLAQLDIDGDGAIHAQILWKREGED